MSEIKRKKSEPFEGFLRRSKRAWQMSGRLIQAKRIKYFTRKKSKNVRRRQTVDYMQQVSKENYLRKVGRLPKEEEPFGRR